MSKTSNFEKADLEVKRKTCKICGKPIILRQTVDIQAILKALNICYSCNVWLDIIIYGKRLKNTVVIEGKHYTILPEENVGLRGFGGLTFEIQTFDGQVIKTSNLWCQGEVPEHFKYKLQDNAKFLVRRGRKVYEKT